VVVTSSYEAQSASFSFTITAVAPPIVPPASPPCSSTKLMPPRLADMKTIVGRAQRTQIVYSLDMFIADSLSLELGLPPGESICGARTLRLNFKEDFLKLENSVLTLKVEKDSYVREEPYQASVTINLEEWPNVSVTAPFKVYVGGCLLDKGAVKAMTAEVFKGGVI